MKRLFFLFALSLACFAASAKEELRFTASAPRVVETLGKIKLLQVDVFMDNDIEVVALQARVHLPAGFGSTRRYFPSVPACAPAERIENAISVDRIYSLTDDPEFAYYFSTAFISDSTAPLKVNGNSGKVMTLSFALDPSVVKSGNYELEFYDLIATAPTPKIHSVYAKSFRLPLTIVSHLGDANRNNTLETNDVETAAHMLLGRQDPVVEANVNYADDILSISDITALIEKLKK